MNKTEQFIKLIENKKVRQAQLYLPYALAVMLEKTNMIDFEMINYAIVNRWSMHGLTNIKDGAWGIIEYLKTNQSKITIELVNSLWIRD